MKLKPTAGLLSDDVIVVQPAVVPIGGSVVQPVVVPIGSVGSGGPQVDPQEVPGSGSEEGTENGGNRFLYS